jgi:hypothetical protein
VAEVIVAPDSLWRWLHPIDGVDPAEAIADFHRRFFLPDFDDSSWKTGRDQSGDSGGFGYGEAGFLVSGVGIGIVPSGQRFSAYFRHTFRTEEEHANLELRCQRDDGIIVYLDAEEVARSNVVGDEAYRLPASEAISGADETTIERISIGVKLPPGEHVLAISLHNSSPTSSDLRIAGISLVALADGHSVETPQFLPPTTPEP